MRKVIIAGATSVGLLVGGCAGGTDATLAKVQSILGDVNSALEGVSLPPSAQSAVSETTSGLSGLLTVYEASTSAGQTTEATALNEVSLGITDVMADFPSNSKVQADGAAFQNVVQSLKGATGESAIAQIEAAGGAVMLDVAEGLIPVSGKRFGAASVVMSPAQAIADGRAKIATIR